MLPTLTGMRENVTYLQNTHLRIYINNLPEDYPPHWHAPMEIIMPFENSYTAIVNNEVYELQPYEILFIGSGVIHSLSAPESGRRYIMQVDISILKDIGGINSILSFLGFATHITPSNAPDIHRQLRKLVIESCEEYLKSEDFDVPPSMRQESNDSISLNTLCEPSIYAKLLTMLTLIGRNYLENIESDSQNQLKRQEYIGKFMKICEYIEDHYTEDLNLEEIAQMSNFSKFHFSRLFKQFTNVSFYKYVNQKRIAHAEELLANPNISITEVAIQSGFSSSSAFIRMFKIIKGCTPTDFRKIQQK